MSKAETARHDADEDGDVMASMIELGLLDVELMDDGEPELCLTEKGTRLVPELGRRWLLAHSGGSSFSMLVSRSASSAGNQRTAGSRIACGEAGKSLCSAISVAPPQFS